MPDDTNEGATPPVDHAAELAAARAEAARIAAERDAASQRAEAAERQRIETEREAVARIAEVARAAAALNEQSRVDTTPQDDGEIMTRGELKRVLGEFGHTFASAAQNSIAEESAPVLRNMRQQNRQVAANDPSLEHFAKYKDEIEATLDKLNPKAAAQPDAYAKTYKWVVSQHLDEIRQLDREKLKAEILAEMQAGEPDYVPDEPSTPSQSSYREPPMPRGDGGRSAVSVPGRQRGVRLSDDERFVRDRYYGGDTAAFLRDRENPDTDIFAPSKKGN